MKDKIVLAIQNAVKATRQLEKTESIDFIENSAKLISEAFINGNKIIVAGNGGSLCDSQHFAEELTGFFRKFRPPYPAIALADSGHITCVSNDLGFEWIFSRGVEAYGKPGDIFIGLTTSGNSKNIIRAVEASKNLGLKTIIFSGKGGGDLRGAADLELCIDGFDTSDRIQEAHMVAIHTIIEIVEYIMESSSEKEEASQTNDPLKYSCCVS